MPVIIDRLDIVDTEPAPPREDREPTPTVSSPDTRQTLVALRTALQRAARVMAD